MQTAPYENAARGLASLGRYEVLDSNPELKASLFKQMRAIGIENPERYVVGNELNSINPDTGQPEFFFKSIGKLLKKAAPMIGSIVGMAIGGPAGAAIGGGLGGLAAGQSPEQALLTAGMSFAGAKFLGPGLDKGIAAAGGGGAVPTVGSALTSAGAGGIANVLPAGLSGMGAGTAAALALAPSIGGMFTDPQEEENIQADRRSVVDKYYAALARGENPQLPAELTPPPQSSLFGLEQTMASNNPADYVSDYQPFQRDPLLRPMFRQAAYGGYIKGPGGPRDDKIPTLLSNTEFVQTGKAVAGADPSGSNNPDKGAKVMNGIMREFERRADANARA